MSSRPLQAGGCPQRDLLTYGDGGLLACGEQEVVSCLQVWGSAGEVSGWPSDAAQSQASPAGLPSHAGGSPMGKGQLPLLSEHSGDICPPLLSGLLCSGGCLLLLSVPPAHPACPGLSGLLASWPACACVVSHVWLLETPWTVACEASLSMGFSRQEYWSGLPRPPPGDLPKPEIEPVSLTSPALAAAYCRSVSPHSWCGHLKGREGSRIGQLKVRMWYRNYRTSPQGAL